MANFKFRIKIEQSSENRKRHYQNHPCKFCGRIALGIEDIYRNKKAQSQSAEEKFRHKGLKPYKPGKKENHLEEKKQDYNSKAAENCMNDSLLSLFQKPDSGILETFSFN